MSAYAIDSVHIALHFSRKTKAFAKPRRRDVAALVDSLHRAETEERETLDREILRSTTRPR